MGNCVKVKGSITFFIISSACSTTAHSEIMKKVILPLTFKMLPLGKIWNFPNISTFKIKKIDNNNLEVTNLKKRRKKSNLKKVVFTAGILMILWIFAFYLYITYQNIEIKDQSYYTAERTQSTTGGQTVEEVEENSKKVADIIEETTQSIVGISKLKNTGLSMKMLQVVSLVNGILL